MQLFQSLEQAAANPAPSVVTIGSFDGIHLAHRELLRRVRTRGARQGAVSVAITFEPHPLRVLAPQKAPQLLTPHVVRLELLAASGVDRLLVLPFTRDFSLWPPERFVEEVLAKTLRASAVIVGDNFHFGYRAAGDVALLTELGKQWGFETEILPTLHMRRMPVSSSQIRSLLEQGNIGRANRLLGRPFSVRHSVESGLGIGRSQTVPTLNLAPYGELLPATGVYITETRIIETRSPVGAQKSESERDKEPAVPAPEPDTRHLPLPPLLRSVTNVGYRPTFVERALGVETHLLEPYSGPPPARIEVQFRYRLRDERKFDSAELLKAQILRDIRRSEAYFRRLDHFTGAASSLQPGHNSSNAEESTP